jgi:DUF218 domain-containing protein
MPAVAPLVLPDRARVDALVAELVANRLAAGRARTPPDLALLELDRDGRVGTDDLDGLWATREIIVVACGADRAGALAAMLEPPGEADTPAALLTEHPRLTVVADRAAAVRLSPRPGRDSDHVLVVLGHREPGISAEHRISAESRARLRHAVALARRTPVRAAVLTGYTSTGGLSEAEQMKTTWDESLAPALLEVAGRDTAENASRSLPIILALGVRHVTVVSSAWHVRVPWFFAPYRRYGLRVRYRPAVLHGPWLRMLREELRQAPRAPARRRAAMAEVQPPRLPGRK